MNREAILLRRIKALTWLFIIGLFISGATAIPLRQEVAAICQLLKIPPNAIECEYSGIELWLEDIRRALEATESHHPFLFYGTDWLAFGHFVIAIAFVGALRDPVRNRWLFDFGLIACVLVIPYALVFGAMRGIPIWWRLIDCSFGGFGLIPLWFCRKWSIEMDSHPRS